MAPRGVPILPRQDGIAFGRYWERNTVALIESIHDVPEPGGEPTLAQWLQRDAHPHIFAIKAHGCRRGLFRLCQADRSAHDKRDQEGNSKLHHSAAHSRRKRAPPHSVLLDAVFGQPIRSRSVTCRQWAVRSGSIATGWSEQQVRPCPLCPESGSKLGLVP